jgi:hypothetical protein
MNMAVKTFDFWALGPMILQHLMGLIDDLASSVEHQEPLLIVNWRKLEMNLGKVRSISLWLV